MTANLTDINRILLGHDSANSQSFGFAYKEGFGYFLHLPATKSSTAAHIDDLGLQHFPLTWCNNLDGHVSDLPHQTFLVLDTAFVSGLSALKERDVLLLQALIRTIVLHADPSFVLDAIDETKASSVLAGPEWLRLKNRLKAGHRTVREAAYALQSPPPGMDDLYETVRAQFATNWPLLREVLGSPQPRAATIVRPRRSVLGLTQI